MAKSSKACLKNKPQKPRPDFPLFPHATGRWAKKVKGKFQYFGKVADDPKGVAAMDRWLDEKDDLLAGRIPGRISRGKDDGELPVGDLCNLFLESRERLIPSGELTLGMFREYKSVCKKMSVVFGLTVVAVAVTGRLKTGHRWAIQNRPVNMMWTAIIAVSWSFCKCRGPFELFF